MESSAQTDGLAVDPAQKQQKIPDVTFKLQFGKTCTDVSMPVSATVGDLKEQAQQLLGIPPAMQKLLIKGSMKPDATTLQDAGVKKGLRVMLIGSRYPPELVACLYDGFRCFFSLYFTGHRISFQQQHQRLHLNYCGTRQTFLRKILYKHRHNTRRCSITSICASLLTGGPACLVSEQEIHVRPAGT